MARAAVLRAGGLGDLVFALPALEALRSRFPGTEIVLLGAPSHAEILGPRGTPVDRVEVVPPWPGLREEPGAIPDPRDQAAFLSRMRRERFDVAVQLHGGGRRSNPLVRSLGARLTVGLRSPDAPELDRWVPYVYHQHEVLRGLEVVALLGARPRSLLPRLSPTPTEIEASRRLVSEGDPIAVLHPGAGDPRRRWPPEGFAQVGDRLAELGAQVVVIGTAPEAGVAARVAAAMRRPASTLAGRLSLPALLGLLARARLVVSNDSGPLHLAAALGTRTVGIYWCGNLINAGPLATARHRPVASWRLTCPTCEASCLHGSCAHRGSFVADVRPQDVLAEALDLWNGPGVGDPGKG
ncbi:MAG TPA: glycosyltransferase family 9 protein [Actinomycetota bacterium]|nr:glycosyltransferase family 9 protein [Actinomycetota bacterium]